MASVKINKNEKYQANSVNLVVHSTTAGLIVHHRHFTNHCVYCQSTTSFSHAKNAESMKDETNNSINEFQKSQWNKYGQIMPTNWIDPFEIYD